MLRDRDKYVIWPAYVDKSNSRSDGRVIPRKISVTSPELKEIVQAAKELGLNPVCDDSFADIRIRTGGNHLCSLRRYHSSDW